MVSADLHCVIRGRSCGDYCFRYALPILRGVVAAGRASASRGFRRSCRSSNIKTNDMLDHILQHLTALVSFDTRNPPRRIGVGGIFDYLRAQLPDFRVEVTDHGDGAVSLFAVRGTPQVPFKVHLDTVPSPPAWSAHPFPLRVTRNRATGLGRAEERRVGKGCVSACRL